MPDCIADFLAHGMNMGDHGAILPTDMDAALACAPACPDPLPSAGDGVDAFEAHVRDRQPWMRDGVRFPDAAITVGGIGGHFDMMAFLTWHPRAALCAERQIVAGMSLPDAAELCRTDMCAELDAAGGNGNGGSGIPRWAWVAGGILLVSVLGSNS